MSKSTALLPEWELVLYSAARLQRIFPNAVLVGGTASAIHAGHRFSRDADHVLTDLRYRFDDVLAELARNRFGFLFSLVATRIPLVTPLLRCSAM